MASSGYLVPKSEDPVQQRLWAETWKRIDRFLPDLRKEINVDDPPNKVEDANPQAATSSEAPARGA